MSWVTFGNVDFMNKSLLRGNAIPFYEQEISTPFVGINLFIPNSYLQRVITPDVKYKQVETNMPGFLAMVVEETAVISPVDSPVDSHVIAKDVDSKYVVSFYDSVTDKNCSEYLKSNFTEVLKKFTATINKNIKVGVPHKKLKDAPESDPTYFYIYLWSQITTNTLQGCTPPRKMWGINVSCTDTSYCPSGKGLAIITDEGHCAAELVGNALYIHHDICHKSLLEEITLFERIVKEAFLLYMLSEEELAEYKKKQVIASNNRRMEKFTNYLSAQIKKSIQDKYTAIRDNERALSGIQTEITKLLLLNKEHSNFLAVYEENLRVLTRITIEEYEKLLKIDKVTEINVFDDSLCIKTKPIYINGRNLKGEEVIYFIGEFEIFLYLSGRIRFNNLSNAGKGPGYTLPEGFNANSDYNRHHPHINSEGKACLGNLSSVVAKYTTSFQLSVLVTLLIKFLETVDTNDHAGKGIYWWPIVAEKV